MGKYGSLLVLTRRPLQSVPVRHILPGVYCFCLSERSLKQKQYVPDVIREAQHRVALKMGKKIGGYLLEYKRDRVD